MATIFDFARVIKQQYPEYSAFDDISLTKAILTKYPEYRPDVDLSGYEQMFEGIAEQQPQALGIAQAAPETMVQTPVIQSTATARAPAVAQAPSGSTEGLFGRPEEGNMPVVVRSRDVAQPNRVVSVPQSLAAEMGAAPVGAAMETSAGTRGRVSERVAMEPAQVKPVGADVSTDLFTSVGRMGEQFEAGVTQSAAALTQSIATDLLQPVTGVADVSTLDPDQRALYERGQQLAESGRPKSKMTPAERNALEYYTGRQTARTLTEWARPTGEWLQGISDVLAESIPENAQMDLEEARLWLSKENPDLFNPAHAAKTAAAAATVAANSAVYSLQGALSLAGPVGTVASMGLMSAEERGNWIRDARQLGIDDPELLAQLGTTYGVFSGLIEQGAQEVLLAPVRGVLKGKASSLAKALIGKAGKKAVLLALAKELGKWVGTGLFEGVEEVSQESLSGLLMGAAFRKMAERHPERAQDLKEKAEVWGRGKGDLVDTFISSAFSGLVLGGPGRVGATAGAVKQAAPREAPSQPAEPTFEVTLPETGREQPKPTQPQPTQQQQPKTPQGEPAPRQPTQSPTEQPAGEPLETGAALGEEEGRQVMGALETAPEPTQEPTETGAPAPTGERRTLDERREATRTTNLRRLEDDLVLNGLDREEARRDANILQASGVDERVIGAIRSSTADALTGIPNKRAWLISMEKSRGREKSLGVGRLDLDFFKQAQDSKGADQAVRESGKSPHDFGDDLLRATGQMLLQVRDEVNAQHSDANMEVYRVGGDEFAFRVDNPDLAESIGRDINRRQSRLEMIQGDPDRVTMTVGVATGTDVAQVASRADLANTTAKEQHRERNVVAVDTPGGLVYNKGEQVPRSYAERLIRTGERYDVAGERGRQGPETTPAKSATQAPAPADTRGAQGKRDRAQEQGPRARADRERLTPSPEPTAAQRWTAEARAENRRRRTRHLRPDTIVVDYFPGASRALEFTEEFKVLSPADQRKQLTAERRAIKRSIASETVSDTDKAALQDLYTQLGRHIRRTYKGQAAETKARRERAAIDRYVESGEATNAAARQIEQDARTVIDQVDNDDLHVLLKKRYSPASIEKAREAIRKGNKDGPAAMRLRDEVAGWLRLGYNPDEAAEQISGMGTEQRAAERGEIERRDRERRIVPGESPTRRERRRPERERRAEPEQMPTFQQREGGEGEGGEETERLGRGLATNPRGRSRLVAQLRGVIARGSGLRRERVVLRPAQSPGDADARAADAASKLFGKENLYFDVGDNSDPAAREITGTYWGRFPGVVFLNADRHEGTGFLGSVGHELFHAMRENHPDLFQRFADFARARYTKEGIRRLEQLARKHEDLNIAEEELYADFSGDVFRQRSFWESLAERAPEVFKAAVHEFAVILDRLLGTDLAGLTDRYFNDARAMRDMLSEIMAEFAERERVERRMLPGEQGEARRQRRQNIRQTELFGGQERTVDEIEDQERRRLERDEVGRRQQGRRGGEADLRNLPMFEDQDIEGSQTTMFQRRRPTFFSPALRAAESLKQNRGTPDQMLAMLKKQSGVKQTELDWLGVETEFGDRKSVTRQELADFIRANQVRIEESTHTEIGGLTPTQYERYQELRGIWEREGRFTPAEGEEWDALDDLHDGGGPEPLTPRYEDYTLPGGTNYRELLLQLPVEETHARAYGMRPGDLDVATRSNIRAGHGGKRYESPHWVEPNVFAHVRVNDRTGPDGEKVLFIEEIQSDWAREARERGTQKPLDTTGWTAEPSTPLVGEGDIWRVEDAEGNFHGNMTARSAEQAIALTAKQEGPVGVAPQPFLKNWHEVAIKRVLRMAAENGYDRVAWVSGQQTADRYDLSRQASRVVYTKTDAGNRLMVKGKNGDVIYDTLTQEPELAEVIGKEPAQRLIDQEWSSPRVGQPEKVLEGLDLRIGGGWAKNLYDRMIPKFLGKYAKKWGATVEQVNLGNTPQEQLLQQSIPVTPQMRRSVMEEGQPMFQRRGAGEQAARIERAPPIKSEDFKRWFADSKVINPDGTPKVVYHGSSRAGFTVFDRTKIGELGTTEGQGFYFTDRPARAESYVEREGRQGGIYPVYLSIQSPMTLEQKKLSRTQRRQILRRIYRNNPDALANYGDVEFEGLDRVIDYALELSREDADLDFIGGLRNGGIGTYEEINKALKDVAGYDGVFATAEELGQTTDVWVAFEPTQIKSAIGNRGTYDPNSPDIRFQRRGPSYREKDIPPWPRDFPKVTKHTTLGKLKRHPSYAAAKAGDADAAFDLVDGLVDDARLDEFAQRHPGAKVVPVVAMEASGANAIPAAFGVKLASRSGLELETEILQANRALHTGSGAAWRLVSRPEFEGPVEAGREYIIVDDVTTTGSTLRELREFIEANGGKVVDVSALVTVDNVRAGLAGDQLRPAPRVLERLRNKLTADELDAILVDYDIAKSPEHLTNSQAAYLARFRDAQSAREKLAAEYGALHAGEGQETLFPEPGIEGEQFWLPFARPEGVQTSLRFQRRPAAALQSRARDQLPTTDDPREALYVLSDGTMLAGDQTREAVAGGSEHAAAAVAGYDPTPEGVTSFVADSGAMRVGVSGSEIYAEFAGTPTDAQVRRLRELAADPDIKRAVLEHVATDENGQPLVVGWETVRAEDLPNVARRVRELGRRGGRFQRREDVSSSGARKEERMSRLVTESKEFKRWFGDSKVVNDDGSPKVVYHGTDAEIRTFDKEKRGFNTAARSARGGFYFTDNPRAAALYPVYDKDSLLEYGGFFGSSQTRSLLEKARSQYYKTEAYQKYLETEKLVHEAFAQKNEVYATSREAALKFHEEKILPLVAESRAATVESKKTPEYEEVRRLREQLRKEQETSTVFVRLEDVERKMESLIDAAIESADIKRSDWGPLEEGAVWNDVDSVRTALQARWPAVDMEYPSMQITREDLSAACQALYDDIEPLWKQIVEYRDYVYLYRWSRQAWAGGSPQTGEAWEAKKASPSPAIMPVYLSIQNPLVHKQPSEGYRDKKYADLLAEAQAGGHDGLIIQNTRDPLPMTVYVAFEPEQIKSAIGNRGGYGLENADIRFQRRPARPSKEEQQAARPAPPEPTEAERRARQWEREANRIRGRLRSLPQQRVVERVHLERELRAYEQDRHDIIMNAIYDYARKLGLRGVAYNQVDTLLRRSRTAAGLRRAVEIMDRRWQRAVNSALRKKVLDVLAKTRAQLKRGQGKGRKAPYDATTSKRILDYINQLTAADQKETEWREVDQRLAWFINNPEKEMPQSVENDIKSLFGHSIAAMSNRELVDVLANIRSLKETGHLKRELIERQREREREAKVGWILKELNAPEPKHPLVEATTEKGKLARLGEMVAEYGWGHIRPERIIEWFARWKPGSRLKKAIYDPILQAENTKLRAVERALGHFKEIHKDIDIGHVMSTPFLSVYLEEQTPDGETRERQHATLTLENMMFVYANSQNPGNLAHLHGTGFTPEMIDNIVQALPDEYRQAVDAMLDYYDEDQYVRMSRVFEDEHGVPMPHEWRYFPIQNVKTSRAENAMVADMLARLSSRNAAVQKGMTVSRIGSDAPFREMSYFGGVVRNLMQTEQYIAYNGPVREVNRLLNDNRVRQAMEGRSKVATAQVRDWLRAAAYGKVRGGENPLDKWSEWLRLNYSTAVLGLNVVTMMKQVGSLPVGMGQVKKTAIVRAARELITDRKRVMDNIFRRSAMMANRLDSYERELAEMAEKRASAKALGLQGMPDKVKEAAMHGIGVIDMAAAAVVWHGKYLEVMGRTGDADQAAAAGDEVVRKTQSMGGIVHLPRLYRAGGIARAYTMFTNDANQRINLLFETFTSPEKSGVERAEDLFWYLLVPSVVMYMASHGGRLPWKDPLGWATVFLEDLWGGFIIVNQILDAGAQYLLNKARKARGAKVDRGTLRYMLDFAPPSMGALEDLGYGVGTGNPYKLLEFAAKFSGTPYSQLKRTVKGAKTAYETKDARYLIWSEYALRDLSTEQAMRSRLESPRGWEDRVDFLKWFTKQTPKKRAEFRASVPDFDTSMRKMSESLAKQFQKFNRQAERARKALHGTALDVKLKSIQKERERFIKERSKIRR